MNYENIFDETAITALKSLAVGLTVQETTEEFVADEKGDMKLSKRKVNEKRIPPNTDILKMLYMSSKENTNKYELMSDEELEKEKIRLLNLLHNQNLKEND